MFATIKCLDDQHPGFTKDKLYTVLSFGESAGLLRDDDGKIVSVSYASINHDEKWELQPLESDKPSKDAAPAKAAEPEIPTLQTYRDSGL